MGVYYPFESCLIYVRLGLPFRLDLLSDLIWLLSQLCISFTDQWRYRNTLVYHADSANAILRKYMWQGIPH